MDGALSRSLSRMRWRRLSGVDRERSAEAASSEGPGADRARSAEPPASRRQRRARTLAGGVSHERSLSWAAWAPSVAGLIPLPTVTNWPLEVKRTIAWYTATASTMTNSMIPTDEDRRAPSTHFELADVLHAVVRGSDLSVYLSEMNVFFWIFIVALVFNIVHLANAIVEVWLEEVVAQCGEIVYLAVLASLVTWPVFIRYLVKAFIVGARAGALQQRTVQFHGRSEQRGPLKDFCNELRSADCMSHSSEITWREIPSDVGSCLIEVVYPTQAGMKDAFTSGTLAHTVRLPAGSFVFCRPKMGKNAANVEMWLICFTNLRENVPTRFWLRATFSCLVTMSFMRRLISFVALQAANLWSLLGSLRTVLSPMIAVASVLYLVFFVGYHGYREISEAMEEIQKQDRAVRHSAPTPSYPTGAAPAR